MLNFLIVVAIVGKLAVDDIRLQLLGLVFPRRVRATMDRMQKRALRTIFSVFATWRHWRPILEDRLGEELPDRFILVSNHQSLMDIPVLWDLLPQRLKLRFVAKKELGKGIPLVSSCLRIQGHALISRSGSVVQTMQGLEAFSRRSREQGFCPVLFPEGTRSRTGELGPFHTAGFRKLLEGESLPVLVAAVDGGSWVASLGDIFRNLGRHSYRVRLLALLPAPKGKKEILAALEQARTLVEAALADIRLNFSDSRPLRAARKRKSLL